MSRIEIKRYNHPQLGKVHIFEDKRADNISVEFVDEKNINIIIRDKSEEREGFKLLEKELMTRSNKKSENPEESMPMSSCQKKIHVDGIGDVIINWSNRVKNIMLKLEAGKTTLNMPNGTCMGDAKRIIEINKERIAKAIAKKREKAKEPSACTFDGSTIHDDEFGNIEIERSNRAKRCLVSITVKDGVIKAKISKNGTADDVIRLVNEKRDRLRSMIEKDSKRIRAPKIIDESTPFSTNSFDVKVVKKSVKSISSTRSGRTLQITVPNNFECSNMSIQTNIKSIIMKEMYKDATCIIPQRARKLANENGFEFKSIKISPTTSRWGCCSTSKELQFSLFVMLLPDELMDYVILHELCHTKEMNHSSKFYALLNNACHGMHEKLLTEIKKHVPRI